MTTDPPVVLDVAQLETLLAKTFNIGLDVGRDKESVALVRLRLSKALVGAAEAQALAAESIALERGVPTEKIAEAEAMALHAGAFNGIPDPVFHLTARAMGVLTGLGALEPDPRAGDRDAVLDAALDVVTALVKLLRFRGDCVAADSAGEQAQAIAKLAQCAVGLARAAEAVTGLVDLARMTSASGRRGRQDLN